MDTLTKVLSVFVCVGMVAMAATLAYLTWLAAPRRWEAVGGYFMAVVTVAWAVLFAAVVVPAL